MSLVTDIEAVLFWKGEPVVVKELAKMFDVDANATEAALTELEQNLNGRGIALVRNGGEVMLYTAPDKSELIKRLTKEEQTREVSKAGIEVLSLVLYRGPISRRDIDHVRGVNSSYIIRNLLIRGLIEKTEDKDARSSVYRPTFELLAHLGVTKIEDLPEFAAVQKDIEGFMNQEQQSAEQSAVSNKNSGE